MLTLQQTAALLAQMDDVRILCHHAPDGDALGSASALWRLLRTLHKRADFLCADPVPEKFAFLFNGLEQAPFEPRFVVSVDVADLSLLGSELEMYRDRLNLCIDHHGSNRVPAENKYVDATAASTTQIIYALYRLLGVTPDADAANCLYTGLSTDTGCFRYQNATPQAFRTAAELLECGAAAAELNRIFFETKSRARVELEYRILSGLHYYFNGKCSVVVVDKEMVRSTGAIESDLDGITALPRQIEGVLVGVTLREKEENLYKVSLRTNAPVNASEICALFGGGGHPGAAGCMLQGSAQDAEKQLVDAIDIYLKEHSL